MGSGATGSKERDLGWSALSRGDESEINRWVHKISKLEGGAQELEETQYWLELIVESGLIKQKMMQGLLAESDELMAMFTASVKTAKRRND